ncbi:MAG: sigma 54-interacting transcriptional regulator [Bacillota bacterium]
MGGKGTGKELVAWLIHQTGPRSHHPFIVVESSGLADDELGDRLFGSLHSISKSGMPYRFGYLELARGGTILIKDIDLLGPLLQVRSARGVRLSNMQIK